VAAGGALLTLLWLPLLAQTPPDAIIPLDPIIKVGDFSSEKADGPLPEGWKPLFFKKIESHTDYRLVEDQGTVVLKAASRASASGLTRPLRIDPRRHPFLEWRWKVMDLLAEADMTKKGGDDSPARVYVTFEYDPKGASLLTRAEFEAARIAQGEYPPLGAINYVWATRAEPETVLKSPYTDRVRIIVLESGPTKLGRWLTEERDLCLDYRRAFGEEPPLVSGVGLMTDTDNTGGSATAFYGDLRLKAAR
jgi:hypothetical protein